MYPSKALPHHGVFVKNRIMSVAKHCNVKVVCPIPYFPFGTLLKRYSFRKEIPKVDIIDNIEVFYPRFLSIPRFFKPLDGLFLFLSCMIFIKTHLKNYDFDLIDSHLAYPDGFGSVLLGKIFKKPVTITLRGHDINSFPEYPVRFRQIKYALNQSDKVFSVAQALKDQAVRFGIDERKIVLSTNGVKTSIFRPHDMAQARHDLDLPQDKTIIVSVGNLVERKGFHILLQALRIVLDAGRTNAYLVIVGGPGEEGDYSTTLKSLIQELKLTPHVRMTGPQSHDDLPLWYSASNFSCLASSKEGWANVLLESLACGKPVVATNVWGTPEVLCSPEYGILTERTPIALAKAMSHAMDASWDTHAILSYAKQNTWDKVAENIIQNYKAILER
jgi:glycosyltransferase involved in cell wall biosynthesis